MTDQPTNLVALTADLCRKMPERLIFHPDSEDEAQFIAEQFQRMGFAYYKADYATQLSLSVRGSIYLDTDKTIMVVEDRRTDGVLCNADQFEQFFIGGNSIGAGRIPPEEFSTRHMVFYPKTINEARGILGTFKAAGLATVDTLGGFSLPVARAAMQGLVVRNGEIRFAPTPEDIHAAEICTAADIGIVARQSLSAEQVTVMAAFNEMAARMEQMAARIRLLENEILPQEIEKKRPAAAKPFKTPRGAK